MGNEPEEKNQKEYHLVKSITLNYEKTLTKNDKSSIEQKEFIKFKNYMMKYQYYRKILNLGCRKNPTLKLLYEPESSFDGYNQQMFYFLENISYVNYQECLHLLEIKYSHTYLSKAYSGENFLLNINKDDFDNNEKDNKNKNSSKNKSSFKKPATFDLNNKEHFNNEKKIIIQKNKEESTKTFNEGVLELIEKICLYDLKKIQKILLIYPINNMRWFIWLSMAKVKFREIDKRINIANKEIYKELVKQIDFNDDSLMFELHNTLKELKIYKYNWSNSLYRVVKCLTLFESNMKYENGMNILLGVPLLISDCNEEETFFFGRYLLSINYGLGLYYFYDENELLLNYLVFIFHSLAKEKYPKIYAILSAFNIADDLWIKKWIKTFFSSIFDLTITIRVWDCVIAVGVKFLVNYSLAILEYFEDKIMSFTKVKEFLEFFDYELKKKYIKNKEIINFRENILSLAESYYIPDGKYQLIEKNYLELLFQEKDNKSHQFDTSKTFNNYYSNNDSLNDDQYQVKLILRSLIYIPNDLKTSDIEKENILKFEKKKSKYLNNKFISPEKEQDEMLFSDKTKKSKIVKEYNSNKEKSGNKFFSSLGESTKHRRYTEPNCLELINALLTKKSDDKKIETKEDIIKEEQISNDQKNITVKDEGNKNINIKIIDNIDNNNSSEEEENIGFNFTFNDEQIPTT